MSWASTFKELIKYATLTKYNCLYSFSYIISRDFYWSFISDAICKDQISTSQFLIESRDFELDKMNLSQKCWEKFDQLYNTQYL